MKQLTLTLTMMLGLILTTIGASFADIQSTRNFYAFSDRLLTAGQPSESALKNASKDGIEVVINLVPPSESIFNPKEEEILTAQGIEYVHLPVSWRKPDPADLEKFLQVMKRAGDKKVLVHCWGQRTRLRIRLCAPCFASSRYPGHRMGTPEKSLVDRCRIQSRQGLNLEKLPEREHRRHQLNGRPGKACYR